ncbi:MAG: TonB-dependent receptor [Blastocatellia bacterium]|nr:TonB-dependent receptor [Blastocatellia bacterium]
MIKIEVLDSKNNPVKNAKIKLSDQDGKVISQDQLTNERGETLVGGLAPKLYTLEVEAEGFQPFSESNIEIVVNAMLSFSLQLAEKTTVTDVVEIQGTSEKLIEQSAAPSAQFSQKVLKTIPAQSREFDQALPIVPNVIRGPDGKISIKGARENQSALLINGADATDPATGNFALSIPLESIEQVSVFTNPYLPEYGKFTGGVTKVDTKRGGEKFKFELNDFFPEPRIRGGKLFGFANVSPRLHLEGPIIKEKLYAAQGLEYAIDKRPVRGLAAPNNEIRKELARSFSQLDLIVSPKQTITTTFNIATRKTGNVNLDFFNPARVAPNQRTFDTAFSFIDRYTLDGGSFLETTFQYKRINARVFGDGDDTMLILPTTRDGNYFRRDRRTTERFQLRVTNSIMPMNAQGAHNVKFGIDVDYLRNRGESRQRPVAITRNDGTFSQLIDYANEGSLRSNNAEIAGFVQDQWLVRRNLNIDYGFRVETQRAISGVNLMPRVAISYSPTQSGNTVFRSAYGLFYDRVPLNALSFVLAPRQVITQFAADGRSVIDGPREFTYKLAPKSSGKPNRGSDFDAPRNQTFNVEFNQKFNNNLLLKVSYIDSFTKNDLYVSPFFTPTESSILLFNNGRLSYRALEITGNVKIDENRNFSVSYIRSKARGEQNDFNTYFGDFPEPVIRPNQFSNLSSDAPNRLLIRGTFNKLPYGLSIVPIFDLHTGFPFSVRNENQDFVGQRNSDRTRFPRFAALDMAITKEVKFKKYTAQFTVSIFNVTDHFNPRNIKANLADPGFGTFFGNFRRFYRLDFAVIR